MMALTSFGLRSSIFVKVSVKVVAAAAELVEAVDAKELAAALQPQTADLSGALRELSTLVYKSQATVEGLASAARRTGGGKQLEAWEQREIKRRAPPPEPVTSLVGARPALRQRCGVREAGASPVTAYGGPRLRRALTSDEGDQRAWLAAPL